MARKAVASDFESRIRPIYHAAVAQGWYVELTSMGHCKWYPSGDRTGSWMWSSTTEKNYDKILKDMQGKGLVYPPPPPVRTYKGTEEVTAVMGSEETTEEVMVTRRTVNRLFAGGQVTRTLLRDVLPANAGKTMRLYQIAELVRMKLPGVEDTSVGAALRAAVERGELTQPARGQYTIPKLPGMPDVPTMKVAEEVARPIPPIGAGLISQEEQAMIAEEQAIIEAVNQQMVALEALFARRRRTMARMLKAAKLLAGEE